MTPLHHDPAPASPPDPPSVSVSAAIAAPPPKRSKLIFFFPGVLEMTRSLFIVLVIALFILTFIVQPFRIPSESMERTLLVGDFLLVNKVPFAPVGGWGWLLPYRDVERGGIGARQVLLRLLILGRILDHDF